MHHRFLWRKCNQDRDPEESEFNGVVFGVTSSPFQAQFVIQKHAEFYRSKYTMASETALKSTYMDGSMDSLTGVERESISVISLQLYRTMQVCMLLSGIL